MEKKKNLYLKKIEIVENCLDKLNSYIEEKSVNNSVMVVVDFLTYKNNFSKLEEIKKCSLNNIIIKVLNFNEIKNKNYSTLEKELNETFDLIVGIGDFNLLIASQDFAIKNNISYFLVNLYLLKSEIFSQKYINYEKKLEFYPPFCVLIEKIQVNKSEMFKLKLNIYKYFYLFLEYNLSVRKEESLKEFLIEYTKILKNINKNNIINKVVSLGLILNKYNINFFIENKKEFENFISSEILIFLYQTIFKKINKNCLYFSRVYKNSFQKIIEFKNFDFEYNKFYLLSFKDYFLDNINKLNLMYLCFLRDLKLQSFNDFYLLSKNIDIKNIIFKVINSKNDLFLKKMENFEIFNLDFNKLGL